MKLFPEATTKAVDDEFTRIINDFDTVRYPPSDEDAQLLAHARAHKNSPGSAALVYSSMVCKAQFHADGTFKKVKCRLVADGSRQPDGSYDLNTYAPAVLTSSRILIISAFYIHAAARGLLDRVCTWAFDVPGAFLHCRLESPVPIFVRMPSNVPHALAGKICRLLGSLYGMKQSNN